MSKFIEFTNEYTDNAMWIDANDIQSWTPARHRGTLIRFKSQGYAVVAEDIYVVRRRVIGE